VNIENDWEKINARKEAYRKKLAELPFGEKLKWLDRMRERIYFLETPSQ